MRARAIYKPSPVRRALDTPETCRKACNEKFLLQFVIVTLFQGHVQVHAYVMFYSLEAHVHGVLLPGHERFNGVLRLCIRLARYARIYLAEEYVDS